MAQRLFRATLLLAALAPGAAWGAFALNFQFLGNTGNATSATANDDYSRFACNFPGVPDTASHCSGGRGTWISQWGYDTTPIVQETAWGSDGLPYWHQIVGHPDTGFAQEVYIRKGPGWTQSWSAPRWCWSASGGDYGPGCNNSTDYASGNSPPYAIGNYDWVGNAWNPLHGNAAYTGNGSGNPQAVVMRMVLDDPAQGFSMEFLKDTLDGKPRIQQSISQGALQQQTTIDMRGLSYADAATAGSFASSMSLAGSDPPVGWDAASDGQQVHLTAGRYTYTAGPGPFGSLGSYSYFEGGYDPVAADPMDPYDWGANGYVSPWDGSLLPGLLCARKRGLGSDCDAIPYPAIPPGTDGY